MELALHSKALAASSRDLACMESLLQHDTRVKGLAPNSNSVETSLLSLYKLGTWGSVLGTRLKKYITVFGAR